MIVKIHSNGKSFAGAAAYHMHDKEAQTNERVAWTHTLNLANDHVPSAVSEMLWTARDAELLKQEAGIRAGGRETENPVKTLSLNWSPEDKPSREHMIATTEEFLRHMKWDERQAIVIAHSDRPYSHVHVMLNTVHPETGLHLSDDFERRRAQAWALEYERAQGRIYCEQRLLDAASREQAPPRNVWQAFQKNEQEFAHAENSLRENQSIVLAEPENREKSEWTILKENQRAERTQFFADGKSQFSELRKSIYREVREEFRERWAAYYFVVQSGHFADRLGALKAEIIADQNGAIESRCDRACAALRVARDERYQEVLGEQREARDELRWRQRIGLDNEGFLNELGSRARPRDIEDAFRDAASEATVARKGDHALVPDGDRSVTADEEEPPARGGRGRDVADRLRSGAISFGGSLLDALFLDLINLGSTPAPPARIKGPDGRDSFELAAEETFRQQQLQRDLEAEADRERRQRARAGD
jgi:hypothetical protein